MATAVKQEKTQIVKEYAILELLNLDEEGGVKYDEKAKQGVFSQFRVALSAYTDLSTNKVYNPLTIEQTLEYMPQLIKYKYDNPVFDEKVEEFWNNMSIVFTGINPPYKMDIGYVEIDGKRKYNNLSQYVQYLWCKNHKGVTVGDTYNPISKFKLTSEKEKEEKEKELLSLEETLMKTYVGLTELLEMGNLSKVQSMVGLYRNKLGLNAVELMDKEQLKAALFNLYKKHPTEFYSAFNDKNLEPKSLIESLVFYKILSVVGSSYYVDNNEAPLAHSLKEMLSYVTNKEKEREVNKWKSELESKQLTFKNK